MENKLASVRLIEMDVAQGAGEEAKKQIFLLYKIGRPFLDQIVRSQGRMLSLQWTVPAQLAPRPPPGGFSGVMPVQPPPAPAN